MCVKSDKTYYKREYQNDNYIDKNRGLLSFSISSYTSYFYYYLFFYYISFNIKYYLLCTLC